MKKPIPRIRFHYGASNDDIAVDDQVFTRHKLSRPERGKLRRILIQALEAVGYFASKASK